MKTITQSINKAQTECNHLGIRLTDKRRNVLQLLLEAGEPLSAYDVVDRYKSSKGETLSAMSAYRMLDFLLQAQLAHKLETTNQYLACSHIACEHEHRIPQFLICDKCHNVTELGLHQRLVDELKSSISDTGFVLASQQLELHGLCNNCQTKQEKG